MKMIDLFCGTKSMSKAFKERGHETFTVDNNPKFNPDMVNDILYIKKSSFPKDWRKPNVIWASPPCETFSLSGSSWYHGYITTSRAYIGLALAYKTLELIMEMKPDIFFIENPRAGLRSAWFMKPLRRETVTYCQYGDNRMKPTDIFNNCDAWVPRKPCKNGAPCHERAPRGSRSGTQGEKSTEIRGIIPRELCLEICMACEKMNDQDPPFPRGPYPPNEHMKDLKKSTNNNWLYEKIRNIHSFSSLFVTYRYLECQRFT